MTTTIRAADHFDLDNLNRRVEEGLISRSVHPQNGMVLYNYTPQAQYDDVWDREILASRGLVLTADGMIQSRPLAKFFNYAQHGVGSINPVPVEPFSVYEKVDGSMIAGSAYQDGVLLTTRGSFQSDQAVAAAVLWEKNFSHVRIPVNETWIFEYVAPWNRIVVPYSREDLVLLACMDNETGRDARDIEDAHWPGKTARRFDGLDLDTILAVVPHLPQDEEGFVLRFESGLRVKVKGDEYLRLHRICTNLSSRTVHEHLAAGTFDKLIEEVPDEFHPWVRDVASELRRAHDRIASVAITDLAGARDSAGPDYNRRELAEHVKRTTYPALCFALEDGKNIFPNIWKMILPERTMAMPDVDV